MKILKCDKCGKEYEKTKRLGASGNILCRPTNIDESSKESEVETRCLKDNIYNLIDCISDLCPSCRAKLFDETFLLFAFLLDE